MSPAAPRRYGELLAGGGRGLGGGRCGGSAWFYDGPHSHTAGRNTTDTRAIIKWDCAGGFVYASCGFETCDRRRVASTCLPAVRGRRAREKARVR